MPIRFTGSTTSCIHVATETEEWDDAALDDSGFVAHVEQSPDVVVRFEPDGRIAYANPSLEAMTGLPRWAFVGRYAKDLLLPRSVLDEWDAARNSVLTTGELIEWDFPYETPEARRWYQAVAMPEVVGGTTYVCLSARDITRLKEVEDRLRREAREDHLTGVATRRHFFDVADSLQHAEVGVCLVDVDDFKRINDCYGHTAGDEVLEVIGRRLRASTRPADVVARHGGDEFAILLVESPRRDELELVARRIIVAVRRPIVVKGVALRVSVSVGMATGSGDVNTLLERADEALYRAKDDGKNTWAAYR